LKIFLFVSIAAQCLVYITWTLWINSSAQLSITLYISEVTICVLGCSVLTVAVVGFFFNKKFFVFEEIVVKAIKEFLERENEQIY